jgi:hypothetical protein
MNGTLLGSATSPSINGGHRQRRKACQVPQRSPENQAESPAYRPLRPSVRHGIEFPSEVNIHVSGTALASYLQLTVDHTGGEATRWMWEVRPIREVPVTGLNSRVSGWALSTKPALYPLTR